MNNYEQLIGELPDIDAARRFVDRFAETHPSQAAKLQNKRGLLSDVLTLVSFSPLLSTTILQHPDYLSWLERKRKESGVRSKDELFESLEQFLLTNSQVEPQIAFARYRRRELMRIYLRDIRRLSTIAEITEELSNLADAILESAINISKNEMEKRYGVPHEIDNKGKSLPSRFCVVALGKLGSRELNYSSDIDLVFLYSHDGETTGTGDRGVITNREFFIKLSEFIIKLIGQQVGEGAAYRVDLRLRPHGSLGALALSLNDTVRYYANEARPWERQVLIRSRGCAGDIELFKEFFSNVENLVFNSNGNTAEALRNVRLSKESIDLENSNQQGVNVKLSRGGIREIEFIAQALQLAYGGNDHWLRSPHTLISLSRLADRKLISETELTELFEAYEFLRRTEHILQMENGAQTHVVPIDDERRSLLARRSNFADGKDFEIQILLHTENVKRIFSRIFGEEKPRSADNNISPVIPDHKARTRGQVLASIEKSDITFEPTEAGNRILDKLSSISPHFAAKLAAIPHLASRIPDSDLGVAKNDYAAELNEAIDSESEFGRRLAVFRRTWSTLLLEIVILDAFEKITIGESKRLQTIMSEESISAALRIVKDQLNLKYKYSIDRLPVSVLALGKLGGKSLDYDSDLDLVVVYDDSIRVSPAGSTNAEVYNRAVEIFVTVLSSMTRDGNLYRVDLRLRPYGKNGQSAISRVSFIEYMNKTAAVWELLAFVKLRAVGGDFDLGIKVERELRKTIHRRAATIDHDELRDEARRIRLMLQKQRSRVRRNEEIDIKYGSGGMLDIYFTNRYLQLRDNVPDDDSDRSTGFMLNLLAEKGSLSPEDKAEISSGYEFLSILDHNLRLTVGRTTKVPIADITTLATIAGRMGIESPSDLLEQLALHRLAIRGVFDRILKA